MSSDVHEPVREVRDPVHGFVHLSTAEWEIVNSPPFQRLRDIRQLAMGHMVYPGAVHTRFEHSIGCVHTCSLIFESIVGKQGRVGNPSFSQAFRADAAAVERGKKILRLAALLHDIGHPPFSHSGETLMASGWNHERMTCEIVRHPTISTIIDRYFGNAGITANEVLAVAVNLSHGGESAMRQAAWLGFLNALLTGELGGDRIDYILRDALHSGQPAGRFDYLKLVDSMMLVETPKETTGDYMLGVDDGGWLVAEQMVAARYLMYMSLYFHKTKRIYEMHLEEYLAEWLQHRFGKRTLPIEVDSYIQLSDSVILRDVFIGEDDTRLEALRSRLVGRNHMRLAYELILAQNYLETETESEPRRPTGRRVPDQKRLDNLEEAVRITFGSDDLRVDTRSHSAAKFLGKPSSIRVRIGNSTHDLAGISEVVRGMSDQIWRARFYSDARIRSEVGKFCEEWLINNPMKKEQDRATQ